MPELRIAGVVPESVTDGPGVRYAIFTQGCPHHCLGCHNPETWSLRGGELCDSEELYAEYRRGLKKRGVTFSGGEPFLQAGPLAVIGRKIKETGGDILVYTGYTLAQLQTAARVDADIEALLSMTDYLVDGPYIEAERDLSLKYRGSRNQRLYRRIDGAWHDWEPGDWD